MSLALRLAFSLLLTWSVGATAAPSADEFLAALRGAGLKEAQVGVVIQDLGAAAPTLAVGEGRAFNPASVMKLVTTLAALDRLGPAHTFSTRVLARGAIADGVLHGDLVLQGGGDPALSLDRFRALVRAIRAKGIREIRGDVLIDNAYYDIRAADPGDFDQSPLKPYNAQPAALLVNFNALPLTLSVEGGGVSAALDPPLMTVDNRLTLVRGAVCNGWEERMKLAAGSEGLRLDGGYSADCGERIAWLNLLAPELTVGGVFFSHWEELGGRLDGRVRQAPTPVDAYPLLEHASPTLAQVVRDINKFSNNVMAKMLYLNLGAQRFGAPATWEKGERAVRAWLEEKGLVLPELVIENGSGLSRRERISAAGMVRLLRWATGQPLYYEFAASLPALGVEGTQRRRLAETPLAGRAWLKSGTLDGARGLAGYVLDPMGRRKVVVGFVGEAPAAAAERFLTEVLRWAMRPEEVAGSAAERR